MRKKGYSGILQSRLENREMRARLRAGLCNFNRPRCAVTSTNGKSSFAGTFQLRRQREAPISNRYFLALTSPDESLRIGVSTQEKLMRHSYVCFSIKIVL
jgi:hypothetical protein